MKDYHSNWNRFYNIPHRDYARTARLSNQAGELGVESTEVLQLVELGVKNGLLLRMASGRWNYELKVKDGTLFLGRFGLDGRRQKLFEGGTGSENDWAMLFNALEQSEKASHDSPPNNRLGGVTRGLV